MMRSPYLRWRRVANACPSRRGSIGTSEELSSDAWTADVWIELDMGSGPLEVPGEAIGRQMHNTREGLNKLGANATRGYFRTRKFSFRKPAMF